MQSKTFYLLLALTLLSFSVMGQINIAGKIYNENKEPIAFASLSLLTLPDSILDRGSLSDETGSFVFEHVNPGKYIILASYIGYENLYSENFTIQLENKTVTVEMNMKQQSKLLQEVVISAKKPFLEQKADRLVINVANSPVAAGRTALEILKKVPGIVVVQEKVTLGGSQSLQIWIDGKPSPYQDMNALLKDMPGDQIEKIELITQPGAQFDAAGGAILNVVLKRNANLGWKGTASLNLGGYRYDHSRFYGNNQNDFGRINPGINLTYRGGKISFFVNGTINRGSYFDGFAVKRYIAADIYNGNNLNKANYFYRAVRAGIDYYVSEKTTLGLTTRIWGRDGDEAATNRTTVANASLPDKVLYAFFTDNVGDDKTRGLYSSLNFKHEFDKKLGKTFTLDLDHSNINSTNINNLTIYPEDIPTQRSLSQQIVTQPIGLYVIKSDYNHPIDSTFKLSLGLKSSIATIDNGLSFTRAGIISPNESNDFLYKENINAAYINVNKTIGKFDLSAGLRTEQTVINGKTDEVTVLSRNYTQFFPSGSAVFRLNDHMAIQSSYAKRVNRPNFNQQNPFTYFIDSLTYTRGNPTLKPEIANVSKLTFTYDNQPVFGISYSVIDSVIVDNAPKLEGTRTFTTADNIAHQSRLELQLNFPIKFGKYIDGFGGNQLIRNAYDATYQDIKYNASRWHWLAYWSVNVKLPKDIKVEIGGFYMTKFLEEFLTIDPLWGLDLGISKNFNNNKGSISLSYDDVFYSQNSRANIDFNNVKVDFRQFQYSRNLKLSFRYNFGNDKVKNAQNRTSASESESSRIKVD